MVRLPNHQWQRIVLRIRFSIKVYNIIQYNRWDDRLIPQDMHVWLQDSEKLFTLFTKKEGNMYYIGSLTNFDRHVGREDCVGFTKDFRRYDLAEIDTGNYRIVREGEEARVFVKDDGVENEIFSFEYLIPKDVKFKTYQRSIDGNICIMYQGYAFIIPPENHPNAIFVVVE